MYKRFLKEWFAFSHIERVGLLSLALIIVGVLLIPLIYRVAERPLLPEQQAQFRQAIDSLERTAALATEATPITSWPSYAEQAQLFVFDPNTIGADSLVLLGFSDKQAQVFMRYRAKGGRFRSVDSFLSFGMVNDWQRGRLAPYVHLAPLPDTLIHSTRTATQQIAPPLGRRETRVLSMDINSADTATLATIPGIGPYFASQMVHWRQRLGGYVSLDQLMLIKHMDSTKIANISPYLHIDTAKVIKLRLHPDSEAQLKAHPYIGTYTARGMLLYRRTRGAAHSLQELVDNHVITPLQATQLHYYIQFDN